MSVTGGEMNLGSAQYTVSANVDTFTQAMHEAEASAQQTGRIITTAIGAAAQQATASMNAMAGAAGKFSVGFAPMGKAIEEASQRLHTFQVALPGVGRGIGEAAEQGSRQWVGLGMSLSQVGYIADDLQYGFRSIVNNLQPLGMSVATAMGMGTAGAMALAGGIGIASVGVGILIEHWGDLADRLESAWSARPIEQFQAMRKAAEEAAAAFDKISAPQAERKEASELTEVLGKHGGKEEVAERLARDIAGSDLGEKMSVEQSRRLSEAQEVARVANQSPESKAALEGVQKDIDKELLEKNRVKARRIIGGAATPGAEGAGSRELLKKFMPEMAGEMEAATPEGQKRSADFAKQADAHKETQKRIKAADDERARDLEKQLAAESTAVKTRERMQKEKNDLSETLTNQGKDNQLAMIRANEREDIWKLQDRKEALQEQHAKVQKEHKPFTGDYFDYVKKTTMESPIEQKKIAKLDAIEKATKAVEKAIKDKQREAARAG